MQRTKIGDRPGQIRLLPRRDHNPVTTTNQQSGRGQTDPAGSTRDQGHAILTGQGHGCLFRRHGGKASGGSDFDRKMGMKYTLLAKLLWLQVHLGQSHISPQPIW
ncbi:MAG: hypothetical protein QUV07_04260 [Cyanobium sp. CZS 25K]|nr:hypothetical protein [Cyanobium sp. CZS25K]